MVNPDEGLSLKFIEVMVVNGTKCAKIEHQDVAAEIEYWSQAVLCSVLGANPPLLTTQDKEAVLGKGIYYFDQKPFVVKAWNEHLEIDTNDINSRPIWVQFPQLDVKYWGVDSLSKLGSLLGIPLKTDKQTMEKVYLNYVRLLIDIPLEGPFPEFVDFITDKGLATRQRVKYEWLPLKCNHCNMFGHLENDCRKKKAGRQEWRPVTTTNHDPEQSSLQQQQHQPSSTDYLVPPHEPRAKNISTSNSFQILLENKIRELITHETGVTTPLMDSILCWNIRGLNGQNKQEELKIFLQNHSIGMAGLLETNVKSKNVTKTPGAWCVLGDFNAVLHIQDRIGGDEIQDANIKDFADCLTDLVPTTHGQSEATTGKEYGRESTEFLQIWNEYLAEGISDHTPLLITFPSCPRFTSSFKLCDMWSKDDRLKTIVADAIRNKPMGTKMYQLIVLHVICAMNGRKLSITYSLLVHMNIWNNISTWLKVSCEARSLQEWTEYILAQNIPRNRKEIMFGLFTATIYHVWRAPNELKYQGKPTGWKSVAYINKEHTRQRILYLANQSQRYRKYMDLVLTN
ncbi:LOW QUALITY PROTEIN: hypothetical protein Cgig2_003405 [Carnegiea gigantea]|uniref:DUF4283 domain-containing protein n=1 Tax=Carnegiea gigantea TaxID=171969 RepID=A0A9Q1K9K9_9CARY|nr:LOW QUALITY PROTEIN: hypothetical protein Cgig2_003405 [Carnegiea gigantea]